MYLCDAQIKAMLSSIRRVLVSRRRHRPMQAIPYAAGNRSLMLTSFLRSIVQCSCSMNMRTEIQPHNLMLYDVKQTILRARAAPRMPCARQRMRWARIYGPWRRPVWQSAPLLACEPQTLEYERWFYLDLPGCYASLIGRDIKKFLAARPAGPTGETGRA
jgi:hypothetical protein